jgi:hypothetical protein
MVSGICYLQGNACSKVFRAGLAGEASGQRKCSQASLPGRRPQGQRGPPLMVLLILLLMPLLIRSPPLPLMPLIYMSG